MARLGLLVSLTHKRREGSLEICRVLQDLTEPVRKIGGPNTMLVQVMRTRVHNGWIIAGNDGVQSGLRNGLSFIGVWSIFDEGNVAPRWTIGGPSRMLIKPRGIDLDVKNQNVIVSDKELNAGPACP